MIHFLSIKWGNKYSAEYVNNLYGMIKRKYTRRFKFVCYTDEPEGLDKNIIVRSIPHVKPLHPDYWFGRENFCWDRAKFLLFNSHHWLKTKGPFCYMDLDVVIQNNIDDIYDYAFTPHMLYTNWEDENVLHDRRFKDIRGSLYNSSIMLWCNDQCEKIYHDVLKHQDTVFKTFWKGTDNYHYGREHQVVGDNFWNFLPEDWYYSFNRGKSYPKDLREHYYREDAKFCLFNTDITPNAQDQIKPHEMKNYDLLIHWHGRDQFERLWLPKLPKDFFSYNTTDLKRISKLLSTENFVQLKDVFFEFPRWTREYAKNQKEFEHMREWLRFKWLDNDQLNKRYMDYSAHETIKEHYNNKDFVSMHKTFALSFPEDEDVVNGGESILWNMSLEELIEQYNEFHAYWTQVWLMKQFKEQGPSIWFWHSTEDELHEMYKKYYFYHVTELFYEEDYEAVFERLYNIMPRKELLRVLNKEGDDATLFKYFQSHGEEYSDLYKALYEEKPDGAIIQLSTKQNDTDNDFNDIFVDGYEHTLKSIKNIFEKYTINWVTITCEITDPINCKELKEICEYFKQQNIGITLQTFTEDLDLNYVDEIVVVPKQEEKTEEQKQIDNQISKDIPVNLATLKQFGKKDEVRKTKTKLKEKDPVWCDARKGGYFYVNSKGNAFPCAFIARDVIENKLFPYHPIDYPFNLKYNNLSNFTVDEVIHNLDFENVSEHLKRRPLKICNMKCGDCHAS